MLPNASYNVSTVQVSQLPIVVKQIEGYFKGSTADRWLQLFDSAVTPQAGAVPLYELLITQTSPFQETLQVDGIAFNEGVFIGISSTEGTFTVSTDKMDINVFTDTLVISTNIVGDKTTAQNTLAVWDEATGAASNKLLYGLIIVSSAAANRYVYLTSVNALTNQPPGFQATISANGTGRYYFGGGVIPFSQVLPSTIKQACTVLVSSQSGVAYGGTPTIPVADVTILAITN